MDFIGYIIGGAQLGLLVGIFFRMGAFNQALRDHTELDRGLFAEIKARLHHLERKPGKC